MITYMARNSRTCRWPQTGMIFKLGIGRWPGHSWPGNCRRPWALRARISQPRLQRLTKRRRRARRPQMAADNLHQR